MQVSLSCRVGIILMVALGISGCDKKTEYCIEQKIVGETEIKMPNFERTRYDYQLTHSIDGDVIASSQLFTIGDVSEWKRCHTIEPPECAQGTNQDQKQPGDNAAADAYNDFLSGEAKRLAGETSTRAKRLLGKVTKLQTAIGMLKASSCVPVKLIGALRRYANLKQHRQETSAVCAEVAIETGKWWSKLTGQPSAIARIEAYNLCK